MKPQIPWLRVFVEGVVIVGSILLAFGLQAWWEGRQEREESLRDLISVAQELAVNRESVLWQLDTMERKLLGSAEVLRILEADRDAAITPLADTLAFWAMSTVPTLDPSSGALNTLIASGRLSLVDDGDVRGRLAGLGDLMADAIENQVYMNDQIATRMDPATYDQFDNAPVIDVYARFVKVEDRSGGPERALVHRVLVPFPNNLAVRNLVRYLTFAMTTAVAEMRMVLQELEELIVLVDGLN